MTNTQRNDQMCYMFRSLRESLWGSKNWWGIFRYYIRFNSLLFSAWVAQLVRGWLSSTRFGFESPRHLGVNLTFLYIFRIHISFSSTLFLFHSPAFLYFLTRVWHQVSNQTAKPGGVLADLACLAALRWAGVGGARPDLAGYQQNWGRTPGCASGVKAGTDRFRVPYWLLTSHMT